MPYRRSRRFGLVAVAILGLTLFEPLAHGQDAAWEGLITAGRNALQQQNFSEAERHFEAALEAAERFPSGDARLGKSYNNLAAVYYAQEDHARAEPLMRRALAQLQESLGPDNTEVAQTMKNLAALYYLQGNRSEAETLLKQSLAIMERVHGPNHAFVATVLSNLAGLYQAENRYRDAEPLLTRSLQIWESLLGSDHPDVVKSRTLLARVRQATGRGGLPVTVADQSNAPTPLVADAQSQAPQSDASDELEEAAAALEQLTRLSKADAGRVGEGGVPVPALSPIGDFANVGVDAAALEPARPAGAATPESTRRSLEADEVLTAALEPAKGDPVEATSLLSDAPSADDVSYAVYLSTLWSVDEARRYWQALRDAMPDVLADKRLEIEEVAADGGSTPFYRVLTMPYSSDSDAKAACERIKSKLRTHDCSIVIRDETAGG